MDLEDDSDAQQPESGDDSEEEEEEEIEGQGDSDSEYEPDKNEEAESDDEDEDDDDDMGLDIDDLTNAHETQYALLHQALAIDGGAGSGEDDDLEPAEEHDDVDYGEDEEEGADGQPALDQASDDLNMLGEEMNDDWQPDSNSVDKVAADPSLWRQLGEAASAEDDGMPPPPSSGHSAGWEQRDEEQMQDQQQRQQQQQQQQQRVSGRKRRRDKPKVTKEAERLMALSRQAFIAGNMKEAERWANEALAADNKTKEAYSMLAGMAVDDGNRWDAAQNYFYEASLNRKDPDLFVTAAHHAADAADDAGDNEMARLDCLKLAVLCVSRALKLRPNSWGIMAFKADYLDKMGQWRLATDAFRTVIGLVPNRYVFYGLLAEACPRTPAGHDVAIGALVACMGSALGVDQLKRGGLLSLAEGWTIPEKPTPSTLQDLDAVLALDAATPDYWRSYSALDAAKTACSPLVERLIARSKQWAMATDAVQSLDEWMGRLRAIAKANQRFDHDMQFKLSLPVDAAVLNGVCLAHLGRVAQAQTQFRSLERLYKSRRDPDNGHAIMLAGDCWLELGELASAERLASLLTDNVHLRVEARLLLGRVLLKKEKFGAAAEAVEKVAEQEGWRNLKALAAYAHACRLAGADAAVKALPEVEKLAKEVIADPMGDFATDGDGGVNPTDHLQDLPPAPAREAWDKLRLLLEWGMLRRAAAQEKDADAASDFLALAAPAVDALVHKRRSAADNVKAATALAVTANAVAKAMAEAEAAGEDVGAAAAAAAGDRILTRGQRASSVAPNPPLGGGGARADEAGGAPWDAEEAGAAQRAPFRLLPELWERGSVSRAQLHAAAATLLVPLDLSATARADPLLLDAVCEAIDALQAVGLGGNAAKYARECMRLSRLMNDEQRQRLRAQTSARLGISRKSGGSGGGGGFGAWGMGGLMAVLNQPFGGDSWQEVSRALLEVHMSRAAIPANFQKGAWKSKKNIQAWLLSGYICVTRRRRRAALQHYLQVCEYAPDEPLPLLLLACLVLGTIANRKPSNQHGVVLRAVACFQAYADARRATKERVPSVPEAAIEQEILYNFGRVFHQMGLAHLAIDLYTKALNVQDERGAELEAGGGGVTMDAAYNLMTLFRDAGAAAMARSVMVRYLVVG